MEQTTVEWLINQLGKSGFDFSFHQVEIEKAKEMEKQQIVDSFNNGYYQETIGYNASEEYYNETFKNK